MAIPTLPVVTLPPDFDLASWVTGTGESVRAQAFSAQPAPSALHAGILHRRAGRDKLQPHVAFFAPGQHPTAKLRAIAQNDRFLESSLTRNPARGPLAIHSERVDPDRDAEQFCNQLIL